MKNITVLIAEDHTIVREGLLMLLKHEDGIEVIAQAEDGREAVKLAAKLQPDVIVMDIAMPHLNGIEATRQIMQARPDAKVLILSAHSDDAYVEAIMALGALPLPPYIAGKRATDAQDATDYQTGYAREPGAVAAPRASGKKMSQPHHRRTPQASSPACA